MLLPMGTHTGSASTFPTEVRESLDAFRRIVQALRTSSRDAERRVGLTSAQLFALQQLAPSPAASVNELATRTFTHQSSVSVVIQRLVERRLVAKVPARDDRRRVELALTDAGRAVLRRSPEPFQHRLIAAIAALNEHQRHVLAGVLADIARIIDGHGPGAHPPMLMEDQPLRRPRARRRGARVAKKRRGSR
jgi:DNA-binding MarR family transcriptional regulator